MQLNSNQYKSYFEKAISYDDYLGNFQREMALNNKSPFAKYLPQNWQRHSRIDRKLNLNEEVIEIVNNLKDKQYWLVITEHWCGDASQIIPVINKIAEENKDKISLRLIYRDQHDELISAHLTDNRSKSIPILLQLDQEFCLINTFGPRPREAQILVKKLLGQEEPYSVPLHTWYAKDKQQSIQIELGDLLR